MDTKKLFAGCAILAAGLLATGIAAATSVTQCGPNVCYTYDDAQVAVALTGQPTLVGDSMQFTASNFSAFASGVGGLGQSGGPTGNFLFSRVYTVDPINFQISMFTVIEEFDYEIISGCGTCGSVEATLYTLAVSNINASDQTSITQTFTDSGDSGGNIIDQLTAQIYPAGDFVGPATDMAVAVQNVLRAQTNAAGELASIQKKFTLATSTVMNGEVVPVPAAVWMFGSALGLLGVVRRRALL